MWLIMATVARFRVLVVIDKQVDVLRASKTTSPNLSDGIDVESDVTKKGGNIILRFAEEIMLLLLGDEDGKFAPLPAKQLDLLFSR